MPEETTLKIIKENKLIRKGDRIIVGVSGGPDSVCLLHILYYLKKELEIKLSIAHVNYKFRGKDSDKDQAFVNNLAKKLKVSFYSKEIDPNSYKNKKTNLEEYFRQIRYDFFEEIRKKEKAQKIALAHNMDDQAETMIMFFLRGSGIRGISGMNIKRGKIIRPLFNNSKEEILDYLKRNKIKYRLDLTNEDTTFTRNKIRQNLIPRLEKEYNPNLKQTLLKSSRSLKEDLDFLSKETEKASKQIITYKNNEYTTSINKFNSMHQAIRLRLLINILEKYKIKISLSSSEEILKLIKNARTGSKKEINQIEIFINYGKITIRKKRVKRISAKGAIKPAILKYPGKNYLKDFNAIITLREVDKPGKISKNVCYIDLEKTGKKLFFRTRKEGERFYPKGIKGTQKIKDLFINNKISREKRADIPIIVNGKDQIVWISGLRTDRRFEASKNSKKILELKKLN